MIALWHWLVVVTGAKDEAGTWYGFWSGFGGSIPDFLIVGGLFTFLRRHNCHERGCPRIGRHVVDGTPWCNHHHESARAARPRAAGR